MGRTANTAIVVAQLYVPKSADSSELVNHGPYVHSLKFLATSV
jgi:acyl-CoA oxidase